MSTKAILRPQGERDRERLARVLELRRAGAASVPALIEELVRATWALRREVVAALADSGPEALSALCEALRSSRDDEAKIAGIIDALASAKGDIDEPLLELTHDANTAVICDAVQVLGRRESARAVARLKELTAHADDNVALSAVEALGRIGGGDALDSLLALAESGNFFRTFPAIDVLGRSGDARVLPTLLKLAADPLYATEAVRALGRLGDPAAVSPLLDLMSRSSQSVVRAVAIALVAIHESSQQRYGTSAAFERALLAFPRLSELRRQLTLCLERADPTEQVAVSQVLASIGEESTVPALLSLLDGPAAVAQVAAASLRKLSAVAEPLLIEALPEATTAARRLILPLLSGRLAARDELVRALSDEDAVVRALACEALAKTSDPAAVRALFSLLADPDARVAQAALGAIQSLGSDETKRLAFEAAASDDARVRRAALRIIGYFGYQDGFPALAAAMESQDERVRDAALTSLPFIDDPRAFALLRNAAEDPSPRTRISAVRALGHGTGDEAVRKTLRVSLGDSDPWVRYYACRALGNLGDDSATDAVAALLSDESGQVRVAAVDTLARLRGARAFEVLGSVLGASDPDLQRAALVALGISKRREAVPKLLDALSSGDASTRLVALSALSELGFQDTLPAIAAATQDPDEGVRVAAAGFLAVRTDAGATNALLSLLAKEPARESLIHALSRPASGRVEAIAAALESADDALASSLVSSLARAQSEPALAAIRAALEMANDAARRAAASALIAMQDSASAALLERAALHDPDAEVRRICSVLRPLH